MLSLGNTRMQKKKGIINIVFITTVFTRSDTFHLGLQFLVSPDQKGRLPYHENDT